MNHFMRALSALCLMIFALAACNVRAAQIETNSPNAANAMEAGEGSMQTQAARASKIDKRQFQRAPAIHSATWLNAERINWDDLRGRVVVVDFWTFACYNCKNTLPYKKAWAEKYRAQGLVVIGVHTPELSFEQDIANVRNAVREYQIKYPVAVDGDFANWNRYGVRAWPTWFIVDKEGYIRYSHIGEGAYDQSEQVIRALLAE